MNHQKTHRKLAFSSSLGPGRLSGSWVNVGRWEGTDLVANFSRLPLRLHHHHHHSHHHHICICMIMVSHCEMFSEWICIKHYFPSFSQIQTLWANFKHSASWNIKCLLPPLKNQKSHHRRRNYHHFGHHHIYHIIFKTSQKLRMLSSVTLNC